MPKQTILFDLDDTLIYCNKFFDLVVDQFVDQLETWFHGYRITYEELKKKQADIDMARVLKLGFSPDHFPQSFVDVYNYYSNLTGRDRQEDEIIRLRELGASVYRHQIEPLPYMEETLMELQGEGHSLHLYTGGDRSVQMRKVRDAGLERFFGDRIYVAQHKATPFLETIIRDRALELTSTWMIGNSLRTDVIPALESGIHSIFIPAETEWAYNNVEINVKPKGAFLTVHTLREVPEAIDTYVAS
ncbi:HAD family hydrolase [Paenibacillus thalictri]|uniref:HAD family hydrolase n=1 Tax=Paenibacillus thalictri TaxID=2527873 RepID=A0A4Q9DSD6_9BACL|nr:HAD family hydrolase [Paenibacillus thalictri]TBL78684.1 HAD family hydrolase [Paenibacillus thalictri]